MTQSLRTEAAVQQRYTAAALRPEAALCCPIDYDPLFLRVIPREVIEKDYGCGDPSKHLRAGETVLDLGSGTGKICFIAAQVVGAAGRVIGVDLTDDMLAIARRNAPLVAERLGYANVEFRKGRIQDLALDLERLDTELNANPGRFMYSLEAAQQLAAELRVRQPLVADASVDVVVSNCVLNLVESAAKRQLFAELFRVLKPGGRAVISDITSDADVPAALQDDPTLWSGCISGAYREDLFLQAFADAGFHGIRILVRDERPWQTVQGIEFRSVTVEAFKGVVGTERDQALAVLYRGPYAEVRDDAGRRFPRGQRVAVSDQTFQQLKAAPYAGHFSFIEPHLSVPAEAATSTNGSACGEGGKCC